MKWLFIDNKVFLIEIIMKQVHVRDVQIGDIVLYRGVGCTVTKKNLGYNPFMGYTLFGDCFKSNHELVTVLETPEEINLYL